MSQGYGTVQWLDKTFSTRAKAEELLRPELENGTISEHDYELATKFLPGYHRYYPYTGGVTATVLTATYGAFYKKPRWHQPRLVIISSTAYVVGAFAGQIRRASAHVNFIRSLDDSTQFLQALQNVNGRLGGEPGSLGWVGAPSREGVPRADVHGDTTQPVESDVTWTATNPVQQSPAVVPMTDEPAASAQVTQHPKSRWNEIRTANARAAQPSSWDVLRQQHERTRNADNVRLPSANNGAGTVDPDAERAQEQARFDAILEAERKIGGS